MLARAHAATVDGLVTWVRAARDLLRRLTLR
jgi:hypothetical protein